MRVLFAILASCVGAFAYTANDSAKTISSDGSMSDTTNALAYVAAKNEDGWVMTVGSSGTAYTWSSGAAITVSNRFTFQGASSSNPTKLIFGAGFSGANGITISAASAKVVTVKDFVFEDASGGPSGTFVRISGAGVCFRISNCVFTNKVAANNWIIIGENNSTNVLGPYGLIDQCRFLSSGNSAYGIYVYDNGSASSNSWQQSMSFGTTNNVVVERNVFAATNTIVGAPALDGCAGSRVIWRYNWMTNYTLGNHGRQCGGNSSSLLMDINNNTMVFNGISGGSLTYAMWYRGGTGCAWSNTVAITAGVVELGTVWRLSEECASTVWASELCPAKLSYPTDYPASQQIGRGVSGGVDSSVPLYIWGNTVPSALFGEIKEGIDDDDSFIDASRDYYTSSRPGYTALEYPHPLANADIPITGTRGIPLRGIRLHP